jgi:Asp-tRNA(Asn)/Glu-tRNA(Gln) amidotransferase A subunit family amidase
MRLSGFLVALVCNFSFAQFEVAEKSLLELQSALTSGEVSSVELVQHYLDRIAAYDKQGPALNSIVRVNSQALADAERLDAERESGTVRGPLHGIPIVVKDNYNTTFMPTTGGSIALAGFVPNRNATQVDQLIAAGAIILAKTNLHEYAYGITTIGSLLGQTRNPYDLRRVPGGSSGGTAAAVAASFAAIGMGSDTCGSIRIPSAFNNLVGLRPTKGLSSIHGIMPLSHTQDVGGPLARSVADLAIVLDATTGQDSADAATGVLQQSQIPNFRSALGSVDISDLRLGRLDNYLSQASSGVRNPVDDALDWFAANGAEIVPLDTSDLLPLIAASGVIGHEFKPDLHQYLALFLSQEISNLNDIVDQGLYHEAVQGVLQRSQASVSNPDGYAEALEARIALRDALHSIIQDNDLDGIVYPPIAELPVMIGNAQPGNNCSLSANSGLPAIVIPLGLDDSGIPVAMEMLGGVLDDAHLLAIAYAWEQARSPRQAPPTTPALVNGQAPQSERFAVNLNEGQLQISGEIEINPVQNLFRYTLALNSTNNTNELYSLGLLIDSEDHFELNDPIVHSLMGPQAQGSSGEIYMSPAFRLALEEDRVYFRVLASGLPVNGVTHALRQ